jgi:hypothetical protein
MGKLIAIMMGLIKGNIEICKAVNIPGGHQ